MSGIHPSIPIAETREYPVRYVAFDTPGVLIRHAAPKTEGGHEWAVYAYMVPNPVWPELRDGIYLEITSFQGNGWLISASTTYPTATREPSRYVMSCRTFEDAEERAMLWLTTPEIHRVRDAVRRCEDARRGG